jgi:hypothetical protein
MTPTPPQNNSLISNHKFKQYHKDFVVIAEIPIRFKQHARHPEPKSNNLLTFEANRTFGSTLHQLENGGRGSSRREGVAGIKQSKQSEKGEYGKQTALL